MTSFKRHAYSAENTNSFISDISLQKHATLKTYLGVKAILFFHISELLGSTDEVLVTECKCNWKQCGESYLQITKQHAGPTTQVLLYSSRIQGWIAQDSKEKTQKFAVIQLHMEDTYM